MVVCWRTGFIEGDLLLDDRKLKHKEQSYTELLFTKNEKSSAEKSSFNKKVDVVFPILHGPFGEDGTIQGLLKMLDIAFVGPGVLGSAINMDKDVSKRLLKEAGLPTSKFLVFQKNQEQDISFEKIERELKFLFLLSLLT